MTDKTFVEMLLYATEHPISPVMPPVAFNDYSHPLGEGHMLLVISEVQGDERLIHVSLAAHNANVPPELGVALATLAPLQHILGVATRWGLHENVLHWHWPQERATGLRHITH